MKKTLLLFLAFFVSPFAWAAPKNSTPAAKASPTAQTKAAQLAGVEPRAFGRACGHNSHLHLDRSGRAFFSCDTLVTIQVGPDNSTYTSTATLPLDQTFRLHSRPGAAKVIYLDFNGHTTTGTPWNTNFTSGADIVTPPFDTDGNLAEFSGSELAAIQEVWRRVAEDYAAWNVDVTTEDPGIEALRRTNSTDAQFGVRCVVGGSSLQWLGASAGGVAYVGSFGSQVTATAIENDIPVFVFPAQLSRNARYIAEAGSHEIGHALGLYHSGQTNGTEYYEGHADWAPIMGVGYYKSVTQWTKGDYPLSNNQQDQLALISQRVPRLADEHGGTGAQASAVTGNTLAAGGVITDRADTDWFKISSGPGTVNISAKAVVPSANLRVGLSLVDASGLVLAQGTSVGMDASLSTPVGGGDYYLVVDGVGNGDALTGYTDYASLGRYGLSGNWPARDEPANQPPLAITTGTSPISGTAPLSTQFLGSGSYDPDGTIVSYRWEFGNGDSAQFANPAYVYSKAGEYTAKLTVTDDRGASSSALVPIVVGVAPAHKVIKVASIVLSWVRINNSTGSIQGIVTITDGAGKALPNAAVSFSLTGLVNANASGTTNRNGQITFKSGKISSAAKGTTTLTVNSVRLSGYVYDPVNNTVSSASLVR
jgi:PKD repeat protein